MRTVILSDVHSNLAALEAVLADAERRGPVEAVRAVGDLVGYGPQPSECLARLREYDFRSVAGNHDLAVVGAIDTDDFNPAAAAATLWNANRLRDDEHEFLASLPDTLACGELTFVHGSLREPVWEYMITMPAAVAQFRNMKTAYSLVGHTHIPLAFREERRKRAPKYWPIENGETIALDQRRLILNAGSVGQPRDGDPRAAYAIYDDREAAVSFHRVEYDVGSTQRVMEEAGLPSTLITRLSRGR